VSTVLGAGGDRIHFRLTPNRATRTGTVAVSMTADGEPVIGAQVSLAVRMLDMNMGSFADTLAETSVGIYAARFPVVGMRGRWGLRLRVTPPGGRPFTVALVDDMSA
jgi:hypothetical protein